MGKNGLLIFKTLRFYVTATVSFMLLAACATTNEEKANLKRLYDKGAQYHQPDRNPVIVIPGILGSRLIESETGTTVWGAFRRDFANPKTIDGARLIALPLTSDPTNMPMSEMIVRSDGVLERLDADLAGFPISIQAYSGILNTLGAGKYRDETLALNSIDYGTDHYTCFQFDYDWRQDIPTNAARLKTFIEKTRRDVQVNYKRDFGIENADIKFDIVAHSMGGLLTRYYARYGGKDLSPEGRITPVTWAGTQDIERLILVAPPNSGSLEAMDQLVNGFNTGRPVLPFYHPALIGSFPSVYQMIPRSRHGVAVWNDDVFQPIDNLLDPDLWERMKWGLANDDDRTKQILENLLPDISSESERHKIAVKFQTNALKRAAQFQAAMDLPANPPEGFEMFLVAGDNTETPEVASIDSETGQFSILKYGLGDKTVLRSSALMDERLGQDWKPKVVSPIDWSATLFIPSKHRLISSDAIFEDNVLYWLLEDPRN
jgi:pimeloyl-ACP methyl ester carboxylesterase